MHNIDTFYCQSSKLHSTTTDNYNAFTNNVFDVLNAITLHNSTVSIELLIFFYIAGTCFLPIEFILFTLLYVGL